MIRHLAITLAASFAAVLPAQCPLSWTPIGAFPGVINVDLIRSLRDGDVVVVGDIFFGGGPNLIQRFDGTSWTPLGSGTGGSVFALVELPNGDLVVGGNFLTAGGVTAIALARWDGSSWGSFAGGANGTVNALALAPNGDLIAGGNFTSIGGVAASRIARFDGTSWHPLGTGMNFPGVLAVEVLPNGDVVAGGGFTTAGGVSVNNSAIWDGSSWAPLNAPFYPIDFANLPNGDLAAIGTHAAAIRSGTTWTSLPVTGPIWSLKTLPNGDLVVGGGTTGVIPFVRRWNGSSWTSIGSALDDPVTTLEVQGDRLFVGGVFQTVGGVPSPYFASLDATCSATAAVSGAGCSGSAGPLELSTVELPWTGTTFECTAAGFAPSAFGISVWGLTPVSTPLISLFSQGLAGCSLFATPDATRLLLPVAGVATTSITLPDDPTFANLVLHHQALAFEFGSATPGVVTAVASTNGLAVTIGSF